MRKFIGSTIGVVALFCAHSAVAAEAVTIDNFPRVETDSYLMQGVTAVCVPHSNYVHRRVDVL